MLYERAKIPAKTMIAALLSLCAVWIIVILTSIVYRGNLYVLIIGTLITTALSVFVLVLILRYNNKNKEQWAAAPAAVKRKGIINAAVFFAIFLIIGIVLSIVTYSLHITSQSPPPYGAISNLGWVFSFLGIVGLIYVAYKYNQINKSKPVGG